MLFYGLGLAERETKPLDRSSVSLIKCTSKNQRRKLKRYHKIPLWLLRQWHEQGFLPGPEPPSRVMTVKELLDYLKENGFSDPDKLQAAEWLFERLVMEELGRQPPKKAEIKVSLGLRDYYSHRPQ